MIKVNLSFCAFKWYDNLKDLCPSKKNALWDFKGYQNIMVSLAWKWSINIKYSKSYLKSLLKTIVYQFPVIFLLSLSWANIFALR